MLHSYLRPILALSCFLSALYVLYVYLSREASASLLVLIFVLFIIAYWITPYAYQQQRNRYDRTLLEFICYWPISSLFSVLTFPVRSVLRFWWD